jgi:hypothetical protein
MQMIESEVSVAECPVEIYGAYVGNGKILALGRYDAYNTENPALWQIQSDDYGVTWTKVATNIEGIASTPSLLYDSVTEKVSLFYYKRWTGELEYRNVLLSSIWNKSTSWPTATIIARGTVGQDAGNVNSVAFDGLQIAAYYSGNANDTGIYLVMV